MKPAFDQSSILLTLRNGLEKGYWTLENLDSPSGGWQLNERQWRKHPLNRQSTHRLHRNLLRNEEDADMY
jgi:hypothetical protein